VKKFGFTLFFIFTYNNNNNNNNKFRHDKNFMLDCTSFSPKNYVCYTQYVELDCVNQPLDDTQANALL